MALSVGTSGGNKDVAEIVVGTAGGNKSVVEGWVGTASGNKLFTTAMAVSLSPSPASWIFVENDETTFYYAEVGVNLTGGQEPYTFEWFFSGDAQLVLEYGISSNSGEDQTAWIRVTDAVGAVADSDAIWIT